ncbi:MAG TPA: MBL fold metallo-hydrolase [Thiobacillaceae bacterium]|mgnify:CR=1 FL=1|nr:MBL fold metallo-hydrolase [Thiobacillaceae bacterium]
MKHVVRRFLYGIALAPALVGCTGGAGNIYHDPHKRHHTAEGFQNLDAAARLGRGFWRWQWERKTRGLPRPPAPSHRNWRVAPDLAALHSPVSNPSVTWIGHATLLLRLGGLNVLTDPHFSERASPVGFAGPRRYHPPGLALAELPQIDVVVISHNHYDHLDAASVDALHAHFGEALRFLVPLGLKPWFERRGITNVAEFDWWDETVVDGVYFVLTPAQHWSGRGLFDRNRTLWGGWAIRASDANVYFAGDTGYSKGFTEIGRRLGPFDFAAIPIGAYAPAWFMGPQHVDPAQALQIHRDVGARQSMGIHWGVFELADDALDAAPQALADAREAAAIPEQAFYVLKIGETRRIPYAATHLSETK